QSLARGAGQLLLAEEDIAESHLGKASQCSYHFTHGPAELRRRTDHLARRAPARLLHPRGRALRRAWVLRTPPPCGHAGRRARRPRLALWRHARARGARDRAGLVASPRPPRPLGLGSDPGGSDP